MRKLRILQAQIMVPDKKEDAVRLLEKACAKAEEEKADIAALPEMFCCPYDNACAESFFSLLKNECIYRAKPRTIRDAMELIDDYIYFYNNERIQLSSKMTPMEVRLLAA